MTRVLLNDRPLLGRRTGVGQYLAQILAHWPGDARTAPRGLFRAAAGTLERPAGLGALPDLDAIDPLALRPFSELTPTLGSPAGMGVARRAFEAYAGLRLRTALAMRRAHVVFEPNHVPPAPVRPLVATIHDLSVLERPGDHPAHRVEAWRRGLTRATSCASSFICVSHATADAMHRVLDVPRDRLEVIHLASRFGSRPGSWTPDAVRARLRLPERYWVHLGTVEPRKNIAVLLEALRAMRKTERQRTKLVIAGRPGWGDASFWSELLGHGLADEVLFTGYITDHQAAALVAGARGVLCPSFYEGFGLPALEAMSLGTPVVVSDAPSLVEIAGDAAPSVPAADPDAWADAMRALTDDDPERIARGVERARGFSWGKAAREHDRVLAAAAG